MSAALSQKQNDPDLKALRVTSNPRSRAYLRIIHSSESSLDEQVQNDDVTTPTRVVAMTPESELAKRVRRYELYRLDSRMALDLAPAPKNLTPEQMRALELAGYTADEIRILKHAIYERPREVIDQILALLLEDARRKGIDLPQNREHTAPARQHGMQMAA